MLLKSLKLKNFLSHADTELTFRPEQRLLVDGKSGGGKSALCDAVVWALFGTGRTDSRGLIRHGADETEVQVILEDDAVWGVTRRVDRKGRHELCVSRLEDDAWIPVDVSGLKETQELIERDLTGSSYALFVNSVVHAQDGRESFVRQTAKRRKDLILELSKAEDYVEWYAKAREALVETTRDLDRVLGIVEILERETESDSARFANLSELEDRKALSDTEYAKARMAYTELKSLETSVQSLEARCESKRDLLRNYSSSVRTFEDKKEKAEKYLDELPDIADRFAESGKAAEGLEEDRLALKEASSNERAVMDWTRKHMALQAEEPADVGLEGRIREIDSQILALLKKRVQACPDTGKPCVMFENDRKTRIAELEERVAIESDRLAMYRKDLQRHAERLAKLEQERPPLLDTKLIDELRKKIEYKEAILVRTRNLEDGCDVTRKKLEKELVAIETGLENARANYETTNNEHDTLQGELNRMIIDLEGLYDSEKRLKDISESLIKANEALTLARSAKERYDEGKAELDKHTKERHLLERRVACLELLRDALKPTGITAMVVDHVVPRLEERINEILGRMSDFSVRLDTQKEGTGKDTVLEGLFISVTNGQGKEFSYEGYSGGEKLKIRVAIAEALAEMQKARFRILDELFIGLDAESAEKFADIMATVGDRFSQLVCVSHLREIKDLFSERLTVVKIDGISKVS